MKSYRRSPSGLEAGTFLIDPDTAIVVTTTLELDRIRGPPRMRKERGERRRDVSFPGPGRPQI